MPYGTMVFNSFGPRNDLFEKAMANAGPVRDWIMSKCSRAALAPDRLGIQIFHAVDAGELTEAEAGMLVRSFLSAGIDTTVYGLGNALYCFASYPEQWQILRENPNLIRGSFEEVLRFEAPVQTFFRTTTKAVDVGGVAIGEGEKVLLFLAAANRDPRRWDNPDTFDVRRRAAGHMTFGTGIHGCVGQAVARLEYRGDVRRARPARRVVRADRQARAAAEQHLARVRDPAAANRAGLTRWRREQS